ncbi:ABC transporter ATP-binding protein [Micromonospora andamanensis]|uniref:ABC transporter ATP-binding protein n=1 Tax=Micromonospora andamanensis TaxID=1287068 RepID=UPI001EF23F6F|nr:ABC transporter ATP-binding protein [Micromonospora andamanensis]
MTLSARQNAGRLRQRQEWQFFATTFRARPGLAGLWWGIVVLRGVLPAGFAVAMGVLIGAIDDGAPLVAPLALTGVIFLGMQVLGPIHMALSRNMGDQTAAWLYDRLTDYCLEPAGLGHLENPGLAADQAAARDFDLGQSAPPLRLSMGFIADGIVSFVSGVACALVLFGYVWWAPPILAGCWLATHWLLRESGIWRDRNTDEVRRAQQDAEYHYRLAVDPAPAKEIRLFGLADWVLNRFVLRRRRLHELQFEATRLRERSVLLSLAVVLTGNLAVFGAIGRDLVGGGLALGAAVTFTQAAIGAVAIAFGGLNWSLDSAAAPVAAVLRLREPMATAGALPAPSGPSCPSGPTGSSGRPGSAGPLTAQTGSGAGELRLRGVTFGYPGTGTTVLRSLDLTVPAGSSVAIVGRNGAGKTTLAKLICRLYDPDEGSIEFDGVDIRRFEVEAWRAHISAVFQDYIRFEWPLRDNVAPTGAPDDMVLAALEAAGAHGLADLDTVLAKGYPGGIDLSGGQWQRVALARTLVAVRGGAGVVLLDEPTAQLDARGELEIFSRVLAETRGRTTVLISHRFSTVRMADLICVVEDGAVVEAGSHDQLMRANGRYRTMFDLQAQRFDEPQEVGGDVLA